MSGILNALVGSGGKIRLPTTAITLTSGAVSIPAPTVTRDAKWYGFAPAVGGYGPIGTVSPDNVNGWAIEYLLENLRFASADGTWTTPDERLVELAITVGGLAQDSFTTLQTPGGNLSTASAASFSSTGGKSTWSWTVTTGSDDSSADYLSTGTVTIVR